MCIHCFVVSNVFFRMVTLKLKVITSKVCKEVNHKIQASGPMLSPLLTSNWHQIIHAWPQTVPVLLLPELFSLYSLADLRKPLKLWSWKKNIKSQDFAGQKQGGLKGTFPLWLAHTEGKQVRKYIKYFYICVHICKYVFLNWKYSNEIPAQHKL